MSTRTDPVYSMPKPWEPQTRQQIEKTIGNLSGRLVHAVADEVFKYFQSFPQKVEYQKGAPTPNFKEGTWGGHTIPDIDKKRKK